MPWSFPALPLAATLALLAPICASGQVRPPFAPEAFASRTAIAPAARPTAAMRCPAPAPPMIDMSGLGSFYAAGGNQSVIDARRMRAYVQRTALNDGMKRQLLDLTRKWAAAPGGRAGAGHCIAGVLSSWARRDALLNGIERNDAIGRRQAILLIAWTAPAIGTSHAMAERSGAVTPADREAIIRWARKLSARIHADFDGRAATEAPSNHAYWAAAALASLASITGDRGDVAWGVRTISRGLATADGNGALPREIARGARALHYQNFAMLAIAITVRAADANGVALSAADEERLNRVARFSMAAWRAPSVMQRRTGIATRREGGMLSWVDVHLPHLAARAPAIAREWDGVAAPYRPFADSFLGIDLSAARNLPR